MPDQSLVQGHEQSDDSRLQSTLADTLAGLSLAGLLLPEAVAYATIAGLPAQAGVCALFAGLVCYGLLGASRYAVVSATSSAAAVLAVATASIGGSAETRILVGAGLVLAAGLFFIIAAILRAGSISDFIAKPVLRGFAFGLAVVIILKQTADVAGVASPGHNLFSLVWALGTHFLTWHLLPVAICGSACLVLFLLARVPRIPGALVVVVAGIAAEAIFGLSKLGVPLVGPISLSFQLTAPPSLAYEQWLRVGELGAALALMLYAESYGAIRTLAMKHGDAVQANRDLMALGVANIVSALFHGMPVGAGFSASAANEAAGARSKLAALFAAVVVLITVLLALPLIAMLPKAVLAAIVIHAVSHMLRPSVFAPYFVWHRDRIVIIASLLAVFIFGVLDGLLVGIGVSLLLLLRRLSESTVVELGRLGTSHDFVDLAEHPQGCPIDGVIVLRPEAALFFANAERILTHARHLVEASQRNCHSVVLSLEESPDLDGSTLEALAGFSATLQAAGKQLVLARLKMQAREVLMRSHLPGLSENVLLDLSVDSAVSMAESSSK